MELKNNDAVVHTDSTHTPAATPGGGEIDLYDEVIAFAELSSDERLRLADRPVKVSAETGMTSAENARENANPELVTHAPIGPVEAETTASSAQEAERHTAPDPVLTQPPIEPVESDPTVPVESDPTVPAAAPARESEVSKTYVEPGEVRPPRVSVPRPSGPLSGFNLPPEIVYTGALSRGVCLACGADSGADDLFCMTCGGFIDEIASTFPFNPTCGKCKQRVAEDEIFCPWCGSVLPGG